MESWSIPDCFNITRTKHGDYVVVWEDKHFVVKAEDLTDFMAKVGMQALIGAARKKKKPQSRRAYLYHNAKEAGEQWPKISAE